MLSLRVIAALQISASVIPSPPTCWLVIGEYGSTSSFVITTRRESCSLPASTCASNAPTASTLNVLHIGNTSFIRMPFTVFDCISSIATPSRPPLACSIRVSSETNSSGDASAAHTGIAPNHTAQKPKMKDRLVIE